MKSAIRRRKEKKDDESSVWFQNQKQLQREHTSKPIHTWIQIKKGVITTGNCLAYNFNQTERRSRLVITGATDHKPSNKSQETKDQSCCVFFFKKKNFAATARENHNT